MNKFVLAVCGAAALTAASVVRAQDDPEYDPEFMAMPDGPGKEFVYLICAECHSMTHVLQRGMTYTRADWRASLTRMTEEFGMADLTAGETAEVLGYLTRYTGR